MEYLTTLESIIGKMDKCTVENFSMKAISRMIRRTVKGSSNSRMKTFTKASSWGDSRDKERESADDIAEKTQVCSTSRERNRRWGCFKTTLIMDITRFGLKFRGIYILFSQK
jgi:hypothetical protein